PVTKSCCSTASSCRWCGSCVASSADWPRTAMLPPDSNCWSTGCARSAPTTSSSTKSASNLPCKCLGFGANVPIHWGLEFDGENHEDRYPSHVQRHHGALQL